MVHSGDPIFRLGLVTLFGNFLAFAYRTYLVIYLDEDLMTSALILSILVSLVNFMQIPFRVPFGKLSQAIGRKPIIVTGIALYTVSIFVLGFSTDWRHALVSVLLFGTGMSCFWPATFSFIGDVSLGSYGRSNGRIFQMGDVGVILGSLLADYFLDTISLDLSQFYLVIGFIGLGFTFLGMILLPESLTPEDRISVENPFSFFIHSISKVVRTVAQLTTYPKLLPVYSFQILISFAAFGFISFFPSLFVSYGYSRGDVGLISLYATLILIFFKPFLGSLSDRFSLRTVVTVGLILISASITLTTLTTDFFGLLMIQCIFLGAMIASYTSVNKGSAARAPTSQRGSALGVLGVYVSLGRALSTMYVGFLYNSFTLEVSFRIFSFSIVGMLGLVFVSIGREPKFFISIENHNAQRIKPKTH